MNSSQVQVPKKTQTSALFFVKNNVTLPTQFIYDQTYKNYTKKQKFQKDKKYSYFNAVMQMKKKLSTKQQIYKNVFQPKQSIKQENNINHTKKSFYRNSQLNTSDINFNNSQLNNNNTSKQIKIKILQRNSFKITKDLSMDLMSQNKKQKDNIGMSKTGASFYTHGRKSQLSQNSHPSFQMVNRPRNNKSYVQFQINQSPLISSFQPFNPRPRLDQIMAEYRKISRHSSHLTNKKSNLPKQVIDKILMTNKMINLKKNRSKSNWD